MKDFLRQAIEKQIQKGEYRQRLVMQSPQGVHQTVDGKQVTSFCSNDYLGLANHGDVRSAMAQACDRYGVGSGSAHLINGHSQVHHELESALARFTQRPAALLFSTGYMANLAVVASLMSRHDGVIADRLVHASLLDACQLSQAKLLRFQHNQADAARQLCQTPGRRRRLLVTEGVFSMDGDQAPLAALAQVAGESSAWFMVDDAHGLGVMGEQGGGSVQAAGLTPQQVPILMATLGKALGSFGAFVAGDEDLIDYLIQFARPYIYTTALPPALANASLASLELIQAEPWRREKLRGLIRFFQDNAREMQLPVMASQSPIQGIVLGDSRRALDMSRALLQQGLLVKAIRPPTVPQGSARLRITLSCEHEHEEILTLLQGIRDLRRND